MDPLGSLRLTGRCRPEPLEGHATRLAKQAERITLPLQRVNRLMEKRRRLKQTGTTAAPRDRGRQSRRCGLCGKTGLLTTTPCCGQTICDDTGNYVLFSYARNSCFRNHSRYTLCSYHSDEGHAGDWQTCAACRESFETEMYVWYGTNEYNFVRLQNPPEYEPTQCSECRRRIALGNDGYSLLPSGEYLCSSCGPRIARGRK